MNSINAKCQRRGMRESRAGFTGTVVFTNLGRI
jgi:hypothetical protein